jgi:hypothetical protein
LHNGAWGALDDIQTPGRKRREIFSLFDIQILINRKQTPAADFIHLRQKNAL